MMKILMIPLILMGIFAGGQVLTDRAYSLGSANAQGVVYVAPMLDAGPGAGSAVLEAVDAGAGSGSALAPVVTTTTTTTTTVPTPSSQLKDPVEDPVGFVGDMATAKKKGWLGLVLVGLYGLLRLTGRVAKSTSKFKMLNEGYPAMVIAASMTVLSGAIDAFFYGGTLVSIGMAALWSLVGFLGVKKPS